MICVLAVTLSACDAVNQAVDQAKTSAATVFAPSASTPARNEARAPRVAGTELANLFKRYPVGAPQSRDSYPRVAITITSATPGLLRLGPPSVDQCVRFNIRLWTDARTSRAFDGLQMCNPDKSFGVPFRSFTYWQHQYVTGETTGAVRTDGPKRPKTNFPTEPRVADGWFDYNAQGFFFLASIAYQLGYDWDQPGEHRLWYVTAPDH